MNKEEHIVELMDENAELRKKVKNLQDKCSPLPDTEADLYAMSFLGSNVNKVMTNGELLPKYKVRYDAYIAGATGATKKLQDKCSLLLDKLYLSGLRPEQISLVEQMQDILGV